MEPTHPDRLVENATAPSAGGFPGPDGKVRLRMRLPFRRGSSYLTPALGAPLPHASTPTSSNRSNQRMGAGKEQENEIMDFRGIKDSVALANGIPMPWLGLGVFRAKEGEEVAQAVRYALSIGYRSIDTAAVYGNEKGVGEGIRQSGVPRSEIFVTTKVWNKDQGYASTLRAFEQSLELLQFNYVDLYLVHWPVAAKFTQTWRALEEIYRSGRARAIGVSNFMEGHLTELLSTATVRPMVNQIEFHPRLIQPDLLRYCADRDIQIEAWSPIMRGAVRDIPEIRTLSDRYGKTPAQIVLRWDLQRGVVTIPKSVHPERIGENADIFDFELSQDEMGIINALDTNERLGPDPHNFDF
jgi:diketogulonate reductase-like aldo/keto reductase